MDSFCHITKDELSILENLAKKSFNHTFLGFHVLPLGTTSYNRGNKPSGVTRSTLRMMIISTAWICLLISWEETDWGGNAT